MSKIAPASALFRFWVRLHQRPLTFQEMLPLRREMRRFLRMLAE